MTSCRRGKTCCAVMIKQTNKKKKTVDVEFCIAICHQLSKRYKWHRKVFFFSFLRWAKAFTPRDETSVAVQETNKLQRIDKAARPAPAAVRQAAESVWQHDVQERQRLKNKHMQWNTSGKRAEGGKESIFLKNSNLDVRAMGCYVLLRIKYGVYCWTVWTYS